MKINPGDVSSDEFEKAKELTKLYHQMEDGEITEDEYNEQVAKIQQIIDNKDKMPLEDIGINIGVPKKESESYGNYFSNHKKEFRNILGL